MNQRLYKINQIAHITCVAYLITETIAKHEDIQKKLWSLLTFPLSLPFLFFYFIYIYIYKENRELGKKKKLGTSWAGGSVPLLSLSRDMTLLFVSSSVAERSAWFGVDEDQRASDSF